MLLSIFIVFVLQDVALIIFKAVLEGFDTTYTSWVRVCLSIALMYAIWIGQSWARWLFVALIYAAALLVLFAVISHPHFLLFALFFVFALTGSLVAFYRSIGAFLQFQREKRV